MLVRLVNGVITSLVVIVENSSFIIKMDVMIMKSDCPTQLARRRSKMDKTEQKRLLQLLEKFEIENSEDYNSSMFDLAKIGDVIKMVEES